MRVEFFTGFLLLFLSLISLGTWPAILRLCSSPKHILDRLHIKGLRPRDTRFAYLDYAISYSLASSLPLAISMLRAESSDESASTAIVLIGLAMVGGSLLSLGNLTMQWATTVYGSALTTVLAIQASLTVTLGTTINYLLEPEKTSRPDLLFGGVCFFLVAIALATKAHLIYGQQQLHDPYAEVELRDEKLQMNYNSTDGHHDPIEEALSERHYHKRQSSPGTALFVAVLGGLCFGFFSPAFNIAVNDPFNLSNGNPLSVSVANLWFSISFTLASLIGNVTLMYFPPASSGVHSTTFVTYLNEPFKVRKLALVAGFVCGVGNVLQFQGGSMVGFATADLVQAFPLVSTVWDVFIFGEFADAGATVICYLSSMYGTYISAIAFLVSSIAQ